MADEFDDLFAMMDLGDVPFTPEKAASRKGSGPQTCADLGEDECEDNDTLACEYDYDDDECKEYEEFEPSEEEDEDDESEMEAESPGTPPVVTPKKSISKKRTPSTPLVGEEEKDDEGEQLEEGSEEESEELPEEEDIAFLEEEGGPFKGIRGEFLSNADRFIADLGIDLNDDEKEMLLEELDVIEKERVRQGESFFVCLTPLNRMDRLEAEECDRLYASLEQNLNTKYRSYVSYFADINRPFEKEEPSMDEQVAALGAAAMYVGDTSEAGIAYNDRIKEIKGKPYTDEPLTREEAEALYEELIGWLDAFADLLEKIKKPLSDKRKRFMDIHFGVVEESEELLENEIDIDTAAGAWLLKNIVPASASMRERADLETFIGDWATSPDTKMGTLIRKLANHKKKYVTSQEEFDLNPDLVKVTFAAATQPQFGLLSDYMRVKADIERTENEEKLRKLDEEYGEALKVAKSAIKQFSQAPPTMVEPTKADFKGLYMAIKKLSGIKGERKKKISKEAEKKLTKVVSDVKTGIITSAEELEDKLEEIAKTEKKKGKRVTKKDLIALCQEKGFYYAKSWKVPKLKEQCEGEVQTYFARGNKPSVRKEKIPAARTPSRKLSNEDIPLGALAVQARANKITKKGWLTGKEREKLIKLANQLKTWKEDEEDPRVNVMLRKWAAEILEMSVSFPGPAVSRKVSAKKPSWLEERKVSKVRHRSLEQAKRTVTRALSQVESGETPTASELREAKQALDKISRLQKEAEEEAEEAPSITMDCHNFLADALIKEGETESAVNDMLNEYLASLMKSDPKDCADLLDAAKILMLYNK
jgi:hypothetical protein